MVEQGLEGHIPLSALRPMYRALAAVNAAVGLDETLQAIADGVVSCTPFQHVVVKVVRPGGDLEVTNVAGPESVRDVLLGMLIPGSAMKRAMEDSESWGRLCFLRDFAAFEDEEVPVHVPQESPVTSTDPDAWLQDFGLMAPMYGPGDELAGVISVDVPTDGRIPRMWVREILEAFAEQAAIAIVNANRHELATARMARLEREREALRKDIAQRQQHEADLRHQARHDPLTGLANSAELRERLADLVADGVPLAVRGGDIVARLGGDEFVVVAVDVGRAEAYALLDRLDQAFAHPVTVDGHPPQLVGASLGIAYDPATEQSDLVAKERAEELLRAADSKMYARKRSRAAISRLTAQAWPTRREPARRTDAAARVEAEPQPDAAS